MELPLGIVVNGVEAFILVFIRMTGLFLTAPIFGRRNIPAYMKVGFSLLLALILINVVALPKPEYYNNIYVYAFLVIKEFIVGIVTGYVSFLIFTAIYLAGQIIDMQIGFGMVNIMDPVSNIQVPVVSNLYFIISMIIFLMSNGHHALIRALFDSYSYIPIGDAVFGTNLLDDMIRIFGSIFLTGFKISAPVIAAMLVTDIALGVVSKTIPQLNVFVVGMQLKIILGIAVIMITVPVFVSVIDAVLNGINAETYKFIRDMAQTK